MATLPPFTPVTFGRYLLQERIAVGGMAEIFRAKFFGAMGFEKPVVIKRILPQFAVDVEFLRMFITEAKLVCHLEHPNIVQVYELGEIESQYFIAMEQVNGIDGRQLWRTLAKRKQRLPGVLALFVVAEFVKGLDYAHRAVGPDNQVLGVVHRDVSPSNILINFRGDVKIGDFGIALVQQESKTQAGVLKGKYGYMSPEQVAGLPVDHRSDIFAAGIVLAELLLGRRLFLGRSDFETLDKVMNVKLDILEQHETALPPEVVKVVRLALARDPADRYQSAKDFHDDIMEFLFSRGERITNDTLAAFIAQHVAPYLTRKVEKGEDGSASGSDVAGGITAARSPVLPNDLVPRMDSKQQQASEEESVSFEIAGSAASIALTTSDLLESADLQDEHAFGRDLVGEKPENTQRIQQSAAPSTAPAPHTDAPAAMDQVIDDLLPVVEEAGSQQPSFEDESLPIINPRLEAPPDQEPVVAPDRSGELNEPPGAAPQLPPPQRQAPDDPDPQFALWDNVIDPDYQFGAIPQLDLGEIASGNLDLDGFVEDSFRKMSGRKDAVVLDAPGTELDLDTGLDENIAFNIPGVVQRPDSAEVAVERERIFSAQLERAEDANPDDKPDFAGKFGQRTVAKVLFRFGVVNESGLLAMTGPEREGDHAVHLEWVRRLRATVTKEQLKAASKEQTCEIYLEDGQPKLMAADRSELSLVAHLLTEGILDRDGVQSALEANPHRSVVAALLKTAKLSPLQISRHVTAFVRQNVVESFSWQSGRFAFYRGQGIRNEAFPTGLGLLELIKKGVGNIPPEQLRNYSDRLGHAPLQRLATPPAHIDAFDPSPAMRAIYDALQQELSVPRVLVECEASAPPIELREALYTLLECELVQVSPRG